MMHVLMDIVNYTYMYVPRLLATGAIVSLLTVLDILFLTNAREASMRAYMCANFVVQLNKNN